MRGRALILIVLVISIGTIFTFSAFAQTQETISVATSKKSYNEGDTIVISGQVSSIILDTPVTLQVFHEGNLVDIVSITVAQDGKFTHTMLAKGPLWQKDGTYIVRASYGANYMVETSFEYKTNPSVIETTDVFEVNAGSYGTFDVQYTVRGATVKSMIIDPSKLALVVFIESEDDGSITLDLPRHGIDAKKSDGTDDSFIILIDGVEVPYKEISTNSNSRTITIIFEQGDSDIKIHGTVIAGSSSQNEKNSEFSVKTDKSLYEDGNTITVSGFIKNLNQDYHVDVTLTIRDPTGNLVSISSVTPKQDGTFKNTLIASGAFKVGGEYSVQASYSGQKAKTTFQFVGGPGYTAPPPTPEPTPTHEPTKKIPDFIDPKKGAQYYLDRYYNEPAYKKWFDTNYPGYTIEEAIKLAIPGSISESEPRTNLFDFIDPKKGTQYILDRYYNEPAYKAWFDTNFPGYTIEEAIAIAISGSISDSVSSIKVTTDSSSYKKGDIIVISGQVENPQDHEVILRITNPRGSPVYQQNLGLNVGAFGDMVIAGNSIQWTDGTYIVKATHNDASTTTTFSFSGSSTIPSTPSPSTARVSIAQGSSVPGCEETNECFIPYEVRVAVGGEVIWSNDDTAAHTVTSGTAADGPSGKFDSSLFMAGTTFSAKFNESGTFPYFCMVHPWMIGVVVVGQGGTSPPPPTPSPNISISVDSDRSLYDLGDIVNLSVKLSGTSKSQNVAVSVADPTGHAVVSRTLTTDGSGMASTEFGIHENFKTGTYSVAVTVSIGGVTYKDTTNFKVQSQFNQIKILSVEGTDQQGNPAPFTRGEIGFVKVVVSANKPIATLATVNLFDSELTTIGIASFRTTLSTGESEMILSFLIPEDAAIGSANIYANAFSDWPSNGGVSLTGESSAQVRIS